MTQWWGSFELPVGSTACWRVGPMRLQVANQGHEWLVGYLSEGDPFDDIVHVAVSANEGECLRESAALSRYCFGAERSLLHLTPRLADRPVVSQPQTELFVPPGEQIQLFVSSPVWVQLAVGEARTVLQEFPVYRPSDTWFGPTTRAGGLSYAGSTRALADPQQLPVSPFRAITPVLVRNDGEDTLAIQRFNLPVIYLNLFRGEDGRLWTQPVTMRREAGQNETASLVIDKQPPREAGAAARLAEPRQSTERNLAVLAFNALFG